MGRARRVSAGEGCESCEGCEGGAATAAASGVAAAFVGEVAWAEGEDGETAAMPVATAVATAVATGAEEAAVAFVAGGSAIRTASPLCKVLGFSVVAEGAEVVDAAALLTAAEAQIGTPVHWYGLLYGDRVCVHVWRVVSAHDSPCILTGVRDRAARCRGGGGRGGRGGRRREARGARRLGDKRDVAYAGERQSICMGFYYGSMSL